DHFAFDAEIFEFFLQDQRIGVKRFLVDLELLAFGRVEQLRRRQLVALADLRELELLGRQRGLFLRLLDRRLVFDLFLQNDRRRHVILFVLLGIFALALVVFLFELFEPIV